MFKKRIISLLLCVTVFGLSFGSISAVRPSKKVHAEVITLSFTALYALVAFSIVALTAINNADAVGRLTDKVIDKLGVAWFNAVDCAGNVFHFTAEQFSTFKNAVWECYGELKGSPVSPTTFQGIPCASITVNSNPNTAYAPSIKAYDVKSKTINFNNFPLTLNEEYNSERNNYRYYLSFNNSRILTDSNYNVGAEHELKVYFFEFASTSGFDAFIAPFVNTVNGLFYYGIFYKGSTSDNTYKLYASLTLSEVVAPVVFPSAELIDLTADVVGDVSIEVPEGVKTAEDAVALSDSAVVTDSTGSTFGGENGSLENDKKKKLNFLPLLAVGSALKDIFPFCIPWDIARIVDGFVAEPIAPRFVVELPEEMVGGGEFVIDFSMFDKLALIVRFFMFMGFAFGLMLITRKII